MKNDRALAVFEDFKIRRIYDEATETWFFSVVDIVAALIQQPDFQTARKYWNKLKERLKKEGSESVTNCHQLKLEAADGKKYRTDVADPETLLRIIQSVPSPRVEPIKLWLARVGYERIQDMSDPARSLDRARDYWKQHGRSEKEWQFAKPGQTDYVSLHLRVFADRRAVLQLSLTTGAGKRLNERWKLGGRPFSSPGSTLVATFSVAVIR